MRILRDFICPEGHISEQYIDSNTDSIICNKCGNLATYVIGCPTIRLDGTDPAFPTAYDRWATIREKRHRQLARRK